MKEVRKCSLSGIAFTMDADAYEVFSLYLESLQANYKDTPGGAEILADIEARIAELILSAQEPAQIVERTLAERIVAQLGSADDISDESGNPSCTGTAPRIPRRLYRDTAHAKLGGVCAGLGRYFDTDPVWVRLGLFAPLLLACLGWVPFLFWMGPVMGNLFGVFVLSYLILWFAVPAARTPRQKLEMAGERITERSIRDTAAAPGSEERARSVVAEAVTFTGRVLLAALKILVGAVLAGLVLGACLLVVLLVFFAVNDGWGFSSDPFVEEIGGSSALPMLGIGVALVPIVALIYLCSCLIASRKPHGGILLTFVFVWGAVLAGCVGIALHTGLGDTDFAEHRQAAERLLDTEAIIDGDTTTLRSLIDDGELIDGLKSPLRILFSETRTETPAAGALSGVPTAEPAE